MENNTLLMPVPFIKTGQALQSLRDSGYSFEAAIAEVVDNSIEAKANNIYIYLFKKETAKGKKHVNQIAIMDDGDGMTPDMLHYYPQIGYSTRYMRNDTIGKYGVGAKLAALNFAKRFDVWSRNEVKAPWFHVYFDLVEMLQKEENGEESSIGKPRKKELPASWTDPVREGTGTIVLWSDVDRLEEGRYAVSFDELKSNLEKEISRMFRHFIAGGIKIWVNDKPLLPHDPLYLMERTYADSILQAHYKKSDLPDKLKDNYRALPIADEVIKIGPASATLKVTLYPSEVTRRRGMGGDELARKLQLPENEGSISFIRMNREVSYTNVPRIFPRGVQEADRFIGIEISFLPQLDSYFGVRNVKRGVEPHGELRREIRERLAKYLKGARELLDEAWGKAETENKTNNGEHASVTEAVKEANRTMPKGKAKGPEAKSESDQILDDLANDVIGNKDEASKKAYLKKIEELPFVIESVDFPGNQFIDIKHIANKVIIRLNTRHRFYREMWEPISQVATRDPGSISMEDAVSACKRAVETLTLLLIAYGKAESMNDNPDENYRDLTNYWGQFLNTLMTKVKNVI